MVKGAMNEVTPIIAEISGGKNISLYHGIR